jgi:DNA-binding NarL/FixJ family response regulator
MWVQFIKERVLGASKRASETRILIADDNDPYRTALSLILKAKNMEVIDEVSTGREAVEATFKNNPDVLLLDVAMPDMDGLAALTTIKYLCPETKIIVLTSLSDPSVRSRAEELGADAFFYKSNEIQILIDSIRAIICESEQLETPDGQVQFNGKQKLNHRLGAPTFTPQEIRIITFLAEGETNATISDRLSIGANTLKSHMRNIFKKSGCQNRTQVALWAIRNGIVE